MIKPKKQFCVHSHDTFVCGREKNGTCIKCNRERHKKWLNDHKEHRKSYMRIKRYSFSPEEYIELFSRQEGKCLGCGVHQSKLDKALSIDHNHENGEIRGLLCSPCNLILGYATDNPKILINLINYLDKQKTK